MDQIDLLMKLKYSEETWNQNMAGVRLGWFLTESCPVLPAARHWRSVILLSIIRAPSPVQIWPWELNQLASADIHHEPASRLNTRSPKHGVLIAGEQSTQGATERAIF